MSTTTTHPPHPLTVGTAPAALWATLLVLRLAMPVIIFAVWVPMLAQRHADSAFLVTALVVTVPALIVWKIISNRLRAALNLRVPGALRFYSWAEPGPGPRLSDFVTATLHCVVTVGSLLTAAVIAMSRDSGTGVVTASLLSYVGAVLLSLGMWRCVATALDRGPFFGKEIGLTVLGRIAPGLASIVAAFWIGSATESAAVIFGLVVCLTLVLKGFFAPLRRMAACPPPDAVSRSGGTVVIGHRASVRKTFESVAEEGADMIVARCVASPSLDDRQRAHRAARAVLLYGVPSAVGAMALLTGLL